MKYNIDGKIAAERNQLILKDYLRIIQGKHRVINYINAKSNGFVLSNSVKTLKFYLL